MVTRKSRGLVLTVAALGGCVGTGQTQPTRETNDRQTLEATKDTARRKPRVIVLFECNAPLHYTGLSAVDSRRLREELAPGLGRLSLTFRDSTNAPEYRIRGRDVGVIRLKDPQGMTLDSTQYRPMEADTATFTSRQGEVQVTAGFLGYVWVTVDLTIRAGWDDVYVIPMKQAALCEGPSVPAWRDGEAARGEISTLDDIPG
jgi:hypothetical protein